MSQDTIFHVYQWNHFLQVRYLNYTIHVDYEKSVNTLYMIDNLMVIE